MTTPKTHFGGFVQQDKLVARLFLSHPLFVLFLLYERERTALVEQHATAV